MREGKAKMNAIEIIKQNARKNPKNIIYPEGEDKRVIKAAIESLNQGFITKAGLIGNSENIEKIAKEIGENLSGQNIEILDPEKSEKIHEFANIFYEFL